MSVEINNNGITIKIPGLSYNVMIKRDDITRIEETTAPDEICNLLRTKGVIFAGTTIDGKVTYYNLRKGGKCLEVTLKDGRKVYIGT
ncbi:hypothetical protein [Sulfolobus acidocaldarius]|uniref:Uncharacterized protein n=4 Tax=Sulfolobus acidocaldarius TaxID=2285 RepID=Q4J7G4_SULAC|nr:hypothetical protein [Sulfolobus acidocaldarius]AAY81267.1 hypothetical protein Saci_1964 [Sulfolobus acidocaldarius DSM 639]AGE71897.1 hypothetical protein SacN8_09700 [Sulfolobus acidocaldarius N8]AGE74170.1 hypothetical protein SacRon12I_09725 [Sulfolobus acidocaldarius Ron12/I]ALU29928.1 hypothetical protein ATY89_08250 [Sulfolobus acidocaldarius]ALU32671.1 hypothetical protein ATZ20_11270 [Sulfolobus acidocaldarius]